MNSLFYPKLAATNIKKNSKFYFPYFITCIFTIAMFYIMCFIAFNHGIKKMSGGQSVQALMQFGCYIVGVFAVIFFFYTNSFLMKRRKKEIGLYNILGLEKKHICKIMLFETFYTALIAEIIGIVFGIAFSKFVSLLLVKVTHLSVTIKFNLSIKGVIVTVILFTIIFMLTLIANLFSIFRSKPIELLHSDKTGEKEPKTKWFIALVGIVTLGAGYYIALTTKDAIKTLPMFFVAVVLVIVGTYALFTTGSIIILKILRKNKNYYYKTKHFTSVSSMIYRMKKNAVGLANICILSTMVLVILSTTVSLYLGVDDTLETTFPRDFSIKHEYTDVNNSGKEEFVKNINSAFDEEGRKITGTSEIEYIFLFTTKSGNKYDITDKSQQYTMDGEAFFFLTQQEYEVISKQSLNLSGNEVAVYDENKQVDNNFNFVGIDYSVKERLDDFEYDNSLSGFSMNVHYVIVSSYDELQNVYNKEVAILGEGKADIQYYYKVDTDGTYNEKIDAYKYINDKDIATYIECRQEARDSFYQVYGGLFFLGIFLGSLFIIITVLIIYYKQISEGYEDKERFVIMQKVGMSKAEVRSSIRSQVMTVFLLPIIVAACHICGSFTMIKKLLGLLGLNNITLFKVCTLLTIIIFTIIYMLVYYLTSKIYYKIVEG